MPPAPPTDASGESNVPYFAGGTDPPAPLFCTLVAMRRYAFFAATGTGTPATFRLTENRLLRLVK